MSSSSGSTRSLPRSPKRLRSKSKTAESIRSPKTRSSKSAGPAKKSKRSSSVDSQSSVLSVLNTATQKAISFSFDPSVHLLQIQKVCTYAYVISQIHAVIHYDKLRDKKDVSSVHFYNDGGDKTAEFKFNKVEDGESIPDIDVKWLHPESLLAYDKQKWSIVDTLLNSINQQGKVNYCNDLEQNVWQIAVSENTNSTAPGNHCSNSLSYLTDMAWAKVTGEFHKAEMYDRLLDHAVMGYLRRMCYDIQMAFCRSMSDSMSRDGVKAFLEVITELVDAQGLLVQQHGTCPVDDLGFDITLIDSMQEVENQMLEKGLPLPLLQGATPTTLSSSIFNTPLCPNVKRKVSQTSVTLISSIPSSSDSSRTPHLEERSNCHNDITVFKMHGTVAEPIMAVDIKSGTCISDKDSFEMKKYLLGILQLKDEAFGLIINATQAKIFRMRKFSSAKKNEIKFKTKSYNFTYDPAFHIESFRSLFFDIMKIFFYSLYNTS